MKVLVLILMCVSVYGCTKNSQSSVRTVECTYRGKTIAITGVDVTSTACLVLVDSMKITF